MFISINYKNGSIKNTLTSLILFVDEKFDISKIKKYFSRTDYPVVSDLLKVRDLKKKILSFEMSSKRKILLVSINKNTTSSDVENLGAKFHDLCKDFKHN